MNSSRVLFFSFGFANSCYVVVVLAISKTCSIDKSSSNFTSTFETERGLERFDARENPKHATLRSSPKRYKGKGMGQSHIHISQMTWAETR